jgi:succinate dehydrogenase hydrophobic anchor subunit
MKNRHRKTGYLLEVPMILMATAIILALLLPMITGITRKVALSIGVLICTGCLYYMILTPGWQPGDGRGRLPLWRRILWFGLVVLSALVMLWHAWLG